MPPNMTKIFYHWGMGDKLKQIASISECVYLQRRESCFHSAAPVCAHSPVLTSARAPQSTLHTCSARTDGTRKC